jgi:TPR repeat protein
MRGIAIVLLAATLAACAPDAATELASGKALLAGATTNASDASAARAHLQRAAEHGLPAAAFHLGLLYRRGAAGLPADKAQAVKWLRVAAEAELPDAQFILGQMLMNGEAGPVDGPQARMWIERAAEHEYAAAHFELAMAYRRGTLGLAPDEAEAQRHLMEAEHGLSHRTPPP